MRGAVGGDDFPDRGKLPECGLPQGQKLVAEEDRARQQQRRHGGQQNDHRELAPDREVFKALRSEKSHWLPVSPAIVTGIWRNTFWLLMDASPPNVRTQPQPPERDVARNDDVRVFIIGQLPRAVVD